jgi:opacity protein-like surface antigen
VGLFNTKNLDASLNSGGPTAKLWSAAYGARVTFLPRFEFGGQSTPSADFDDDFGDDFDAEPTAPPMAVHTWMGLSAYGSQDFHLINAFVGAGGQNGLEGRLELSRSQRSSAYRSLNASMSATWTLFDWFVPALRIERGTTESIQNYETWQYIAGVEFFPMPGVEIRPEYRIAKTDGYIFGQPTIQIHLFF